MGVPPARALSMRCSGNYAQSLTPTSAPPRNRETANDPKRILLKWWQIGSFGLVLTKRCLFGTHGEKIWLRLARLECWNHASSSTLGHGQWFIIPHRAPVANLLLSISQFQNDLTVPSAFWRRNWGPHCKFASLYFSISEWRYFAFCILT